MPSSPKYGYRKGGSTIMVFSVDSSTTAIIPGDMVVAGTAGYVQKAAAGERPIGVAVSASAVPSADGDLTVRVETDLTAIFEYPPDAGTVTQGLVGTTMDIGGAQSIDIDASADDIFVCLAVDTVNNTVSGRFLFTHAGVV